MHYRAIMYVLWLCSTAAHMYYKEGERLKVLKGLSGLEIDIKQTSDTDCRNLYTSSATSHGNSH